MPEHTDIKSIMIISSLLQDSHYLFEQFEALMYGRGF